MNKEKLIKIVVGMTTKDKKKRYSQKAVKKIITPLLDNYRVLGYSLIFHSGVYKREIENSFSIEFMNSFYCDESKKAYKLSEKEIRFICNDLNAFFNQECVFLSIVNFKGGLVFGK